MSHICDVLVFATLMTIVPLYQNLLNLFFTFMLMVLYTLTVNSPNGKGNIDFFEGVLFTFALGFFFDEVTKMSPPPPSRLLSSLVTETIVIKMESR